MPLLYIGSYNFAIMLRNHREDIELTLLEEKRN